MSIPKKVIYLTGAPATGKSTLTKNLAKKLPESLIFTYSKELLKTITRRGELLENQDEIRKKSAQVVTLNDIKNTDEQLLKIVKSERANKNIIIDSHPVTIERYGFRIAPFSKQQLHNLKPDVIVCLFADSSIIKERIKNNAAGRPLPSKSELNFHTNLQAQVAIQYALEVESSIYFIDVDCSPSAVVEKLLDVTKIM